jgi:uncharacterized protein DUF1553/uncharacterized protein DUF1549
MLCAQAYPQPADKETVWWSLHPLTQPAIPQTGSHFIWPITPIDRFILAKLEAKGLAPSRPAEKRTLLRRVTFNLTGLPPTPEELDAFLADDSPEAYERVVDRLLASPHYGERWARHWMDVAHYAETHGHDQDRPRPNAWPYRDYLIRSFNEDKPYARFVQEQVAGDVIYPDDPQATVALGFLATGPWDESSLRDIREDTLDREIARYLDRDDIITTVMSTFTSTTVHCARCHDHKFDPITMQDYYGLQAVFAGTDKAERAFDPDPGVARRRRELTAEKAKVGNSLRELRSRPLAQGVNHLLLTPAVQAQVAAWEKEHAAKALVWHTLDAISATSANGAVLMKQPDLSILSTGTRPATDTYTITAQTEIRHITGVRLEVLTDPTLPRQGPGRQDNGNLHLSEIKVFAAPMFAESGEPVKLHHPTADYNQEGWTVAHAIDGNPKTAWGVYPNVGNPHVAVFEFTEPIGFDNGTSLTIMLEQLHGSGHLIGRARLSITTAPHPSATAEVVPQSIAEILAIPADERKDQQRADLAAFVLEDQINRRLAALPAPQLVYAGASDFKPDGSFKPAKTPREVHILKRGDITKPGETATAGALACVVDLESRFKLDDSHHEGARRAALAHWLTDPKNPLTWRSIVNRVWHYHFGRGIVDTPNDLGRMGGRPSHPELLDWLAADFRDHGGSLKRLHKLIVMSAAYRQASRHDPRSAQADTDNRFLWRMNRTRLDAESVRDAVLLINGKLDRTMGGASVKQFIQTPGIHVTPNVDYLNFDVDRPENHRRCVYRFVFRTLPDPLMEALDCPDASQWTAARGLSLSPLQALALLNDKFMVRQAEHLAERATQLAPDLPGQLAALYQIVLLRPPTCTERDRLIEYAGKHGLANACRVLLNCNEFVFVD